MVAVPRRQGPLANEFTGLVFGEVYALVLALGNQALAPGIAETGL